MPIGNYRFEGRIFSAIEQGILLQEEAEAWEQSLASFAEVAPLPVVALVDAREARNATAGAMVAFVRATRLPNVLAVVVVVTERNATVAQVVARTGEAGKTHLFYDMDEAERFVRGLVGTGSVGV